ncbi:MAG: hypothetical protein CVV44_04290 [Spirochaetae bacterium HGW-Spirochaetae-1]|jgi:hypothetical protein|nr:MAG: hypothetical protein CVV44_04290 [Spirochaetae bacterium HGW-Spirochaetae-1]
MGLTTIEYIILYSVIALATIIFYKIFSNISKFIRFVLVRTDNTSTRYDHGLIFNKSHIERRTEDRRKTGDRRLKQRLLYCRNVFACEVNDRRVADRRKA